LYVFDKLLLQKKKKTCCKEEKKSVLLIDVIVQQGPELRLPLGQGIAGHVASTGKQY
jgi:hypothetical protein